MNIERFTDQKVLEMMVETKILFPKIDEDWHITEKDHRSSLMAVRRFFIDQKVALGRAESTPGIQSEHIVWRNRYLRILLENRNFPPEQRLAEIYNDESYVHHHYSRDEYSIYDTTDHKYAEVKKQKKERRYCICTAIERDLRENRSKLLPECLWIFCPNGRGLHQGD